ncbi:MAG TPA: RteC domain-containing protein [Hymenobacter sp.]|jgi:hypothetical protein|uniref:RteC domain-containing protein n=1 Tax=Hymenobacter sp. TaxID=1898978 RepID=UPI002ED9C6AB
MDYLYQLPDEDREEEGFIRASNYALSEFLKLDLKGITAKEVDEFITDAWWKHIEKSDLSDEEANDLLERIQDENGAHIPYSAGWPTRFAGLVEDTPLYSIELRVNVWVVDKHRFIYWRPVDAYYVRYHWQILQERVHELTIEASPEANHIKIPRLNAAIDWLKGYEQRLATAQEVQVSKTVPLAWQGSKAELVELGYSLLESGVVAAPNRAGAVKKLGELFGIELGDNPATHLQTIQKRKPGGLITPLLDQLREAFVQYMNRKDESEADRRKRKREKKNTA